MNNIGSALLAGFGLVLLWLSVYYGWRPYRLDRVRNDLFAIRDELFLYAANGGVSFNEPAYRMMRDKINALIRYAHIITLSRAVIFGFAERLRPNEYAPVMQQYWLASLSRLPDDSRKKLEGINDRVMIVMLVQVATGSPFLMAVLLVYGPVLVAGRLLRRGPHESTRLKVAKELRVELIEEQAVLAQAQERETAAAPCPVSA